MTDCGARGVSFPLATTSIALIPSFQVEAGFIDAAQLVYRGRGERPHSAPPPTTTVDSSAPAG